MNSFCGILDVRNAELDFARLKDMGSALRQRGATSLEACVDRGVGILSAGDPSPLIVKATPQGELYAALEGPQVETSVSTNAVLDTYLSLGYDTPSEIDGHFALVIFDRKKRELLLATDPLGALPIFLCRDGHKIIISTAILPLLRYSPEAAEVDRAALLELMRAPEGEVGAADIYKNIFELPRGHFMIFSGLGTQILKYPEKSRAPAPPSDSSAQDITPDKRADLKKCAEEMTMALGYPAFDTRTPEYIAAIRASAQSDGTLTLGLKRQCLSNVHTYRKLYALSNRFGVDLSILEAENDLSFKKSFLSDREKKLSELASAILKNERSHTRRLFGNHLETIVSKTSDISERIGVLGKIIGLERWLESYPIVPI